MRDGVLYKMNLFIRKKTPRKQIRVILNIISDLFYNILPYKTLIFIIKFINGDAPVFIYRIGI